MIHYIIYGNRNHEIVIGKFFENNMYKGNFIFNRELTEFTYIEGDKAIDIFSNNEIFNYNVSRLDIIIDSSLTEAISNLNIFLGEITPIIVSKHAMLKMLLELNGILLSYKTSHNLLSKVLNNE